MNHYINRFLVCVCGVISPFAYSEIYQCDTNGKMVFQQTPCPIENVVSTGCDANFDYIKKAGEVNATFDDRYCYYLQIDNLESKEKQLRLQAYKERRAEVRELVKRDLAYDKLQQKSDKSSVISVEKESYVKGASNHMEFTNASAFIE